MNIILISEIYNQNRLKFKNSGNEESIINLLLKQKEWNILNDEQKRAKRMHYLRDFKKHFLYNKKQQKIFQYENLVFEVSSKIDNFIETCHIDTVSTFDELLFRIKCMLFCEKEFINQFEKIKKIGHVPFSIFEPLIKEVQHTEEYKKYKLDELFEEYEKMYQLFLEKPYEEK